MEVYNSKFGSAPMPITDEDTDPSLPPRSFTVGTFASHVLHNTPVMTGGPAAKLDANRLTADAHHGLVRSDSLLNLKKRQLEPFHVKSTEYSMQGIREDMEDDSGVKTGPLGTFIIVCDGHGVRDKRRKAQEAQDGLKMARRVVTAANQKLFKHLDSKNFHFESACKDWAKETHESLPKNEHAGTTAAIAFIERVNGMLNVGNIGDSKVVVFREHDNAVFAIPMSPIINWDSPECVARVKKILTEKEFAAWSELQGKNRRFGGLNLASTLGDYKATEHGKSALTHKPVCSQFQLKPGDKVLVCCDGVSDFASLQELQDLYAANWLEPDVDFAKIAVNFALVNKQSTDNVTAVVATMVPGRGEPPVIQRSSTEPLDYTLFE